MSSALTAPSPRHEFERFLHENIDERESALLPRHIIEILPEAEEHAYGKVPEMQARLAAVKEPLAALCAASVAPGRSKRSRLEAIRAAGTLISDAVSPISGCRGGACNSCCHIPVAVSQAEAELIGREIGRPARKLPRKYTMPKEYGYAMPCTFLKAGRCSIYAARPVACRLHLVLDVNDRLCRLLDGVSVPVPLADVTQFQEFYVMANGIGEPMGDIRAFFG